MICGDASNYVYIFWRDGEGNITGNEKVKDSDGNEIIQGTRYSMPQLIDWNNNGLLDLLVGGSANSYYVSPHPLAGYDKPGLISLYLNTGSAESYEFSLEKVLTSESGDTITSPAYSHFTMGDLDGDDLADIITVGKEADSIGYFRFWKNIGTANNAIFADSELLRKEDGKIIDYVGPTWMFIDDYNNDGIADLVYNSSKSEVGGNSLLAGYLWISYGVKSTESYEFTKAKKYKDKGFTINTLNKSNINFVSPKLGVYEIKIFSLDGRTLFNKNVFSQGGKTNVDISWWSLKTSAYAIEIKGSDSKIVQKFIVQ